MKAKEYACQCDACKSLCENRVCWPTPKDVEIIIKKGYGDRLMLDYWAGENEIQLLCPAIKGLEGGFAPFWPIGQCTFLTEDGLCEIHDIKPTEGKVAGCRRTAPKDIHKQMADTWNTDKGRELVKQWRDKK